jgi:D-serine deaminase-like pyridoxal phosphate-dependent protein
VDYRGSVVSTTIDQLETPQVLVDRERLIANLDRMQQIADSHRVRLRPHIKTHKSIDIAQLQLERGAVGVTASKAEEALVFIQSGKVPSVTVAYPLIDVMKIERLITDSQRHDVELRLVIDSDAGVTAAAAAAQRCGSRVRGFVEIDVGLHRCGVSEDDPRLLPLVTRIAAEPHLEFVGILSHAGHAYAAGERDELVQIATQECAILNRVRARIENSGVAVHEVSVGATPTALASETFDGLTEMRPGNYAFLDATAVRLGIARWENVALSIVATVVSANDHYWIVDAGSKVLSSDLGAHGTANTQSYGVAFTPVSANPLRIARLSEEHGWIERSGDANLRIGDRVRIVPNHACPVANLADQLVVVSGSNVVAHWPVTARGKVR